MSADCVSGQRRINQNKCNTPLSLAQHPVNGVPDQTQHHTMPQSFGRVARRQVHKAPLANLSPPAGLRLQVVARDRAQQEMLAVEVILHGMLLVEDFEILHAGGDRMILILDAHGEGVGFGMAVVIAAEQFVIESTGRINSLGIVQGKETAAVVHEIPDGLLLRVGHPLDGRLVVAVGPVHTIAQDDENLMVVQRIGVESADVFDECGGDIFAEQRRRQAITDVDGAVVAVADQDQSIWGAWRSSRLWTCSARRLQ